MANSLELLEEKFRRVEEATERRAFDERELQQGGPSTQPARHRKKRGVSVTHFGEQEEQRDDGTHSIVPSSLFAAASKSTFYHTLANPRSVDSFENSEETREDEEPHEIQVERIAGRQTLPKTMGALLPRRLIRAQSQLNFVSVERSMVVDVSVETTTEPSYLSPDLQMSAPSRPRAATVGIAPPHGGLVERAKDFARRMRRKSRAELL